MGSNFVNILETPYELWRTRRPTIAESVAYAKETGSHFMPDVKQERLAKLETHFEAASHMLQRSLDNVLERHIDQILDSSPEFNNMLRNMPKDIPSSIDDYKQKYPACDLGQVSTDINDFGILLSEGQYLFHGGRCRLEVGDVLVTDRPLSTSFCPQVALRNAEWRGKAYDSGEVHLIVLRVKDPTTKTYVFNIESELGYEKEVLFSSGARVEIRSKTLIRNDYKTYNLYQQSKQIPAYVIEADIS